MSLRSLLMPSVTQWLLSRDRLQKVRAKAERSRRARAEPHRVHYFHQVDDPYSALAAQCLSQFVARYHIELVAHVVGPPPESAAPDRTRLIAYSRADAQMLAAHRGLNFTNTGTQPASQVVQRASSALVAAIADDRFVELAAPITSALWSSAPRADTTDASIRHADALATNTHLRSSDHLRQRLGHYLGATFFYGGEWYWGIDRLHHLEQRLQALGAQQTGTTGLMFAPESDLQEPVAVVSPPTIDFYFSLRSPYSAIAAPRVFELSRLTGAPVRLKYVLPMVMRGLPVPRVKRMYIAQDAAREAFVRNIPFGRVNDPVGRPTERGLSLMPLAEQCGRSQAYVLSFMQGVWAEGLDAGSDRGLRRIVERAGLSWGDAVAALKDEAWRATAQANRQSMLALGLWGVPSFQVGNTVVWGQDRMWAVQQAVLAPQSPIHHS